MESYVWTSVAVLFVVFASGNALKDLSGQQKNFTDVYNRNHGDEKPKLIFDQAWMTLINDVTFDLEVYAHNEECWKCDPLYITTIEAGSTRTLVMNTTFQTDVELRRQNTSASGQTTLMCWFSLKFRERGDYWLFFNQSDVDTKSCDVSITNDPMGAEIPIVFAVVSLAFLAIITKVIGFAYRKRKSDAKKYSVRLDRESEQDDNKGTEMSVPGGTTESEQVPNTHNKRQRLHSLDTFRGLSLVLMVFVNYGGGGYWFFEHPPWDGLTLADLVFPWFVFIMGVSMNYSFRGMLKRKTPRWRILVKVVKRSALLFAFGIILNTTCSPVDLQYLRIPGVLQRLSLSYLTIALMETVLARPEDRGNNKSWAWLRDVVYLLPEWFISLCLLATYVTLTFVLPVPGCPTGYIGPGGLHDSKRHENCTGGAAGYIDRLVLGDNHLYGNPTPKKLYQTVVPYDPEGILGTLSSAFLCFLGLQIGRVFLTYKTHRGRLIRLCFWAIVTGAIGGGLCNFSLHDGIIPVNKNLWSVSFIMITACFGCFLLAFLYVLVDVLKIWDGDPFIYPGMNPLVIFLCHDFFYFVFPVNFQLELIHWKLLARAIWDVVIWVTVAIVLYSKKIFIAL